MASVISQRLTTMLHAAKGNVIPGMPAFDPMNLLHGEESVEVFKPILPDTRLSIQDSVVDLQDKGKATLVVVQSDASDAMTNEPVFRLQSVLFVREIGGFGHKGSIKLAIPKIPEREADKLIMEPTLPNSAFLYRLNGDLNPQHVDPELSTFERPIMHGLCTYGFTARAISDLY